MYGFVPYGLWKNVYGIRIGLQIFSTIKHLVKNKYNLKIGKMSRNNCFTLSLIVQTKIQNKATGHDY